MPGNVCTCICIRGVWIHIKKIAMDIRKDVLHWQITHQPYPYYGRRRTDTRAILLSLVLVLNALIMKLLNYSINYIMYESCTIRWDFSGNINFLKMQRRTTSGQLNHLPPFHSITSIICIFKWNFSSYTVFSYYIWIMNATKSLSNFC